LEVSDLDRPILAGTHSFVFMAGTHSFVFIRTRLEPASPAAFFPLNFNAVRAGRWRPKPRGTLGHQLVDPGRDAVMPRGVPGPVSLKKRQRKANSGSFTKERPRPGRPKGVTSHLSKNPKIQAPVAELVGTAAENAGVTIGRIVAEMAKIGFSDVRRA
jgi:hypothetical protein